MPRTFTLKRLLINITVLCVAFALIRAFPEFMLRAALLGVLFLPAVAVVALFAFLPPRRFETIACAAVGGLLGFVLRPQIYVSWAPGGPTWWGLFTLNFSTLVVPTAIGAFFLGGIGWVVALERFHFRSIGIRSV